MPERIKLTDRHREGLKRALKAHPSSQRELAEKAGLAPSALSKVLSGEQDSLPSGGVGVLVGLLGLDAGDFFPQLELALDDALIREIQQSLEAQLRRLQAEVGVLRGTAFQAFVGFRVRGVVNKVYEGVVALPQSGGSVEADAA